MSHTPKHIVFISTRLDLPGGIEKSVISTANLLASNSLKITIVIADETDRIFYTVDPRVQIIHLNLNFGIHNNGNAISRKVKMFKDVFTLRKTVKKLDPDFIIATEYHLSVSSVLAGLYRKYRLCSWEHHHINSLKKNAFWRKLIQYSYPKLYGVICLNDEEKLLFQKYNNHVITIPNFTPGQNSTTPSDKNRKTILTVARLNYTKGIDRLMEIAKRIMNADKNVKWTIIGDGELELELQQFILKNNLQDRLILKHPVSNDLSDEYKSADIFVLTSRYECFPMTLLEAMSFGVPCIAFDCNTGPRHIIRNQVNGFLASDGKIEELSNLIIRLLENEEDRIEIANQALLDSRSFSPDHIYLLWDRLLNGN